jgi:hypothetical protein
MSRRCAATTNVASPFVTTVDSNHLRIDEDGQFLASVKCVMMAAGHSETVWFETDSEGTVLWNRRTDELAMFDKALTRKQNC